MRKNFVTYLTFLLLLMGLAISLIWLIKSEGDSRFEPSLTVLGLFATITGIFTERLASSYERKRELLIAFYRELVKNEEILKDSRFNIDIDSLVNPIVFPRLIISVTEAAIASGVFEEKNYRDIFHYLNEWRDIVNEFNHRLDITELCTFTSSSSHGVRSFYKKLTNSGEIDRVLRANQDIAWKIKEKYLKRMRIR